jgi:hypothetical protein
VNDLVLASDIDAALDAHDVQRLTLRRPPGGGQWLALAIGPRGIEGAGIGPDVATALAACLGDLARLEVACGDGARATGHAGR